VARPYVATLRRGQLPRGAAAARPAGHRRAPAHERPARSCPAELLMRSPASSTSPESSPTRCLCNVRQARTRRRPTTTNAPPRPSTA